MEKLTFALRESCLLLSCATVVIAATLAHMGLLFHTYITLCHLCYYANLCIHSIQAIHFCPLYSTHFTMGNWFHSFYNTHFIFCIYSMNFIQLRFIYFSSPYSITEDSCSQKGIFLFQWKLESRKIWLSDKRMRLKGIQ